jgi:hypothetical protein
MNMQPGSGATTTQIVACAVWCCDKKQYQLKKRGRSSSLNCQRLGSKKHSCVTHALRKHTKSGKLTTKTKYPGIKVPTKAVKVKVGRKTFMAKPDTILDGTRSVDVKFPCDSDEVKEKNKTLKNGQAAVYPSEKAGRTLMKDKEDKVYRKIPGIKSSTTMTPERAEEVKHKDCKCN